MKFQFPGVCSGDQPLAKEPEDSGCEIDLLLTEFGVHTVSYRLSFFSLIYGLSSKIGKIFIISLGLIGCMGKETS